MTLLASNGDATLTLETTTGLSSVIGNGTSTVTFSGTIANLNSALDDIDFAPASNFSGTVTLQVFINDEGNTGTGGARPPGQPDCFSPCSHSHGRGRHNVGLQCRRAGRNRRRGADAKRPKWDHWGCLSLHHKWLFQQPGRAELHACREYHPVLTASTGVLTLSGNDTLANYQTALRSVTYQDTSSSPSTVTRAINFSFHDDDAKSELATDNVVITTLTIANNAPTIVLPGAKASPRASPSSFTAPPAITVADVDAGSSGTERVSVWPATVRSRFRRHWVSAASLAMTPARRFTGTIGKHEPRGAIRLWRVKSAFWGVFRETPARELAG